MTTNREVNFKNYKDDIFDNLKTSTIRVREVLIVPTEPNSTVPTTPPDQGRFAYDDVDNKMMYSDGYVWTVIGNGTVSLINTGTGLTGGPITTTGTISMADTTVVAGSYTYASFTVNAQGQLTAASSGVQPVTSVTAGTGISITGTASAPIVNIANTTVVAGSYTNTSLTVNAQGQLTAASSGPRPSLTSVDFMMTNTVNANNTHALSAYNNSGCVPIVTYAPLLPVTFNQTTGVMTAATAGMYIISSSSNGTPLGAPQIVFLFIEKTDGLAVDAVIATSAVNENNSIAKATVSCATYLNVGDSVQCGVSNSGALQYVSNIHVSITFVGI